MSNFMYNPIGASWAASGNLLKFPLYDLNDYDDDWASFESQQAINLNTTTCRFYIIVA